MKIENYEMVLDQIEEALAQSGKINSLQIARIICKRHAVVLEQSRRLLARLDFKSSSFKSSYLESGNRKQTFYIFDRTMAYTLLTLVDIKIGYHLIIYRLGSIQ